MVFLVMVSDLPTSGRYLIWSLHLGGELGLFMLVGFESPVACGFKLMDRDFPVSLTVISMLSPLFWLVYFPSSDLYVQLI